MTPNIDSYTSADSNWLYHSSTLMNLSSAKYQRSKV